MHNLVSDCENLVSDCESLRDAVYSQRCRIKPEREREIERERNLSSSFIRLQKM